MKKFNKKDKMIFHIDCNGLGDQLMREPKSEHQFDTTSLPQRTDMTPWAIKVLAKQGLLELEELEDKMSSVEKFSNYIQAGYMLNDGYNFDVFITEVNATERTATGVVLATHDWFHVGETVYIEMFEHDDDVGRITSELDDHGQALFLGVAYGGISVGS